MDFTKGQPQGKYNTKETIDARLREVLDSQDPFLLRWVASAHGRRT